MLSKPVTVERKEGRVVELVFHTNGGGGRKTGGKIGLGMFLLSPSSWKELFPLPPKQLVAVRALGTKMQPVIKRA